MSEMNYFIAIPLPNETKTRLSTLYEERKGVLQFRKWVHVHDYHITLKYLGACSLGKIEQVKEQLAQVVQTQENFTLSINRLGYFGPIHSPRILWVDVEGDRSALNELQKSVEKSMANIGFDIENRPYRPHVTLAKNFKGNEFDYEKIASRWEQEQTFPPWKVTSIVLYRTELQQQPMYVSEAEYTF